MPLKRPFEAGLHRAYKPEGVQIHESLCQYCPIHPANACRHDAVERRHRGRCDGHTYNASTHVLTIPKVAIGAATYSNMLVNVGAIVTPPSGSSPNNTEDTYDPASGNLTVAAVKLGSATYFNVVVHLTGMVSVGSVTGADTYDGTHLTVASVQLANSTYTNVELAVGLSNIVQLTGGMPGAGQDQYIASLGRLYIPAVQVGATVHTNVALNVTAGNIVPTSAGGTCRADRPGQRRPAQLLCCRYLSHQRCLKQCCQYG